MQQSGWTIGRNVRIDIRWATINARREFADTSPPNWPRSRRTSSWPPWRLERGGHCCKASRTVPIVFSDRSGDPVGAGFVDSLARPGGNVTGFMHCRI